MSEVADRSARPARRRIFLMRHGSVTYFDESGKPYKATADDSAYAIFQLESGLVCQFNSSWCTRVRRDDLLTIQVDGTKGTCVAGLLEAWVQSMSETPKPVWNPDEPSKFNFFEQWEEVPDNWPAQNGFKAQWEMFLKHVAEDAPYTWDLWAGARGVQLADLGLRSAREGRRVEVPELDQ